MLEEHTLHQSLNTQQQLLGADRELVICVGGAWTMIALAFGSILGSVVCLLLWFLCIAMLQKMGKADPLMRHVYFRHRRYKAFYPAKAAVTSRSPKLPPSWNA